MSVVPFRIPMRPGGKYRRTKRRAFWRHRESRLERPCLGLYAAPRRAGRLPRPFCSAFSCCLLTPPLVDLFTQEIEHPPLFMRGKDIDQEASMFFAEGLDDGEYHLPAPLFLFPLIFLIPQTLGFTARKSSFGVGALLGFLLQALGFPLLVPGLLDGLLHFARHFALCDYLSYGGAL